MAGGSAVLTPAGLAFALVVACFAFGAVMIAFHTRRSARPAASAELWRTYAGTVAIVAAVLVPAALHPALFAIVAGLASYRCALELAAIGKLELTVAARIAIATAVGGGAWLGAAQTPSASSALMAVSAAALMLTAPFYARALSRPHAGARAFVTATAFPVLAAAHLSHLIYRPDGFLWVFLLYASVELQDSMAFLFGRILGRHALLPRLSPRKTIEGAIAGAVSGIAVGAAIAHFLLEAQAGVAFALGVLLVAAGFAGDVFASALKRAAGVKDFPPVHALHGGVMDIYDSTLFAVLPLSAAVWLLEGTI